jgi:hypothetical protein
VEKYISKLGINHNSGEYLIKKVKEYTCILCGENLTDNPEKHWFLVKAKKKEENYERKSNCVISFCEKCLNDNTSNELRKKVDSGLVSHEL